MEFHRIISLAGRGKGPFDLAPEHNFRSRTIAIIFLFRGPFDIFHCFQVSSVRTRSPFHAVDRRDFRIFAIAFVSNFRVIRLATK